MTMTYNAGAEESRPQVRDQLDNLSQNIKYLGESILGLKERLSPIVFYSKEDQPSDEVKSPLSLCDIARELYEYNATLVVLKTLVDLIIRSLEI